MNAIEKLGVAISDFVSANNLAWPDELRKAWEEAAASREFIGLDLVEMDEIIDGNIKITDSRLRDGVYAVVIDTMTTLMEKNT